MRGSGVSGVNLVPALSSPFSYSSNTVNRQFLLISQTKARASTIDERFDIFAVTDILRGTTVDECLDLSGYTQYIQSGTDIYNCIAEFAVKDDPLWGEQFVLKANRC